jgi:dienelactone hydrolase
MRHTFSLRIFLGLASLLLLSAASLTAGRTPAQESAPDPLPGTARWTDRHDPAKAMVESLHNHFDRLIASSPNLRSQQFRRDFASPPAYVRSLEAPRERLARVLGTTDPRMAPISIELVATIDQSATLHKTDRLIIRRIRWPVIAGLAAEGLLVEPKNLPAVVNAVALPDCNLSPEQFVGLQPGLRPESQVPRLLAQAGCRVVVPALLSRDATFSGHPAVRMTNLPHREWIYRMAYETGRHIMGYEIQSTLAAIDWFTRPTGPKLPLILMGYGEGGRIALYASALDDRPGVTWIAGAFSPRESTWSEPIDRNVWGLLTEFGDAEVAGMILPRRLLIEACDPPTWPGAIPIEGRANVAASGRLLWKDSERNAVETEFRRLLQLHRPLGGVPPWFLTPQPSGNDPAPNQAPTPSWLNAGDQARQILFRMLELPAPEAPSPAPNALPEEHEEPFRTQREKRILLGMQAVVQQRVRTSELRRDSIWSKLDRSSPDSWKSAVQPLREQFHRDVIGLLPPATEPLRARTIKLYDEPRWTGYAVELPVWSEVPASGILLLPKDIRPSEKRAVVVCQHGLEGRAEDVVDPKIQSPYHAFGAKLADLGYIVYAPQNPYVGHDRFRTLQRKANLLQASLFSVIVRQHERTLEWLQSLPQVDPARIAFYGLSYGGKTAMRVPAILTGYALSICSADFNEWVVKCTNIDRIYSYMFTVEYDMYEFGLSEFANYAEMAALIAPRPFQVERGHDDGVAPDEWIGYEFAKVRRLYDLLGIPDRADITYFNGPHEIRGTGTFPFLNRQLGDPVTRP